MKGQDRVSNHSSIVLLHVYKNDVIMSKNRTLDIYSITINMN